MSGTLSSFLLSWLLWGVLIWCVYAGLPDGRELRRAGCERHQRLNRQRQAHRAQVARIDRQADASVQRIAAAFRGSGYDIRTALRALLLSPAFWSADNRAVLVKSPAEYVVGTLRQLDVPVGNAVPLALVMAGLVAVVESIGRRGDHRLLGYEHIEHKLAGAGADIERITLESEEP